MATEIQIPFPLKDVPLKPEMTGRVKIDETMVQTLAAVLGWDGEARRLLTCALSGSLHTTTPPVDGIINGVSTGAAEDVQLPARQITEIMIIADKSNGGDIWVNIGAAAAVNTGWPLDAGDSVVLSVNNQNLVHLHIVTSGDRYHIMRTV